MSDFEPIVEIRGLTKQFRNRAALADVDLKIYPGRIIGMLGSNGCGKSTLIRHIIGLYLPTKGTCVTFGCDAAKLGPKELSRIGYVHQEGKLLHWMTVKQLIRYTSSFYSNWNNDLEGRYIDDFKIRRHDRVGALSPGERQKLAILLAIGHEPDLLILDEPTSALDPITRAQFLELLLNIIQQEGKTILIASHILTDVEKIIDQVIMMKDGRIIENRSIDDLREDYLRLRLTSLGIPLPSVLPFKNVLFCQRDNYHAIFIARSLHLDSIKEQAGFLNCSMDIQSMPLEELYKIIMET